MRPTCGLNASLAILLVVLAVPGVAPAAELTAAEAACDPLFDECPEDEAPPLGFPDPWEPANRGVLRFNGAVDTFLLDPLTRVYGFTPEPVKRCVRRFFANTNAPATFLNDMLQLEWEDAGVTALRFSVNSTIGLAGLFDPAQAFGLEPHHSDFGQTLALAGLPSGPYLILPLLGPTNVRDGFGQIADAAGSPLVYLLGPLSIPYLAFAGSSGLSLREEVLFEMEALEESSVDWYAALRSAYYQNRLAEIWSRREDRRRDVASALP